MNIREYIDSGILFDYCTGALSPDQKAEVDRICTSFPEVKEELDQLFVLIGTPPETITPVLPPPALQETIWGSLDNINREKSFDIRQLPVINKYSDYENWKRIVQPFMPGTTEPERTTTVIRDSGGITQMLVVSRTDVADEIHENERESFLVLEGECECHIGNDIFRLGPGGYIEIPLHTHHNVHVLSPYVVAVLQHVAI